jgi:endonuclease YncB( thermonuclease family)
MLLRLFLILIIALPVSASPAYEGKVVGISDGDTITVLVGGRQQIKVRLAEIDAPEKSQAYGQRSKQSLSDLVFGKQVRIEQQNRDRHGRIVGKAYVGSLDVNAEQVKRGMARFSFIAASELSRWRIRRDFGSLARHSLGSHGKRDE